MKDIQRQAIRRAGLKLLAGIPDYSAANYILREGIEKSEGLPHDKQMFDDCVRWWQEHNLVTLEGMEPFVTIKLTALGLDVAHYKVAFNGVSQMPLD